MSELQTSERVAWEAIVAEHRSSLRSYLRRRTPSATVADEVLAATIVRAWEKFSTLRERTRARAWLFAVARTALHLYRRSQSRHERWIDADAVVEVIEVAHDERADDERCRCSIAQLDALPAPYAEILRRVDVEGDSLAEAAAALSISVNNATVRLSRARGALRARMLAHCGTSSAAQCSACGCDERGCCAAHGITALRAPTITVKGSER
jgi:RNA polymerase sigma factor (sigma-70 family)